MSIVSKDILEEEYGTYVGRGTDSPFTSFFYNLPSSTVQSVERVGRFVNIHGTPIVPQGIQHIEMYHLRPGTTARLDVVKSTFWLPNGDVEQRFCIEVRAWGELEKFIEEKAKNFLYSSTEVSKRI